MRAICLIDTSVFLEILDVPFKANRHATVLKDLEAKFRENEGLFLPMATVLETGNHIGQNGDGHQRRQCAERFARQVSMAVDGQSPFTPLNFLEAMQLRQWLSEFPSWAMEGRGLGDLSIMHDWKRECAKHPGRRVYIWSLDEHLSAYDTRTR